MNIAGEIVKTSKDGTDGNKQIAMFNIGSETFGIGINLIREIVRYPSIITVPKTPDYVQGLTNLRGNVLPVIDSRVRLGLNTTHADDDTRVLVVEIGQTSMGVIVDKVKGVVSIDDMTIEPPSSILSTGVDSRFIQSVIKGKDNDKVIMELNVDALCAVEYIDSHSGDPGQQAKQKVEIKSKEGFEEIQLVTFLVENEEYAFPIETVREVLRVGNITEVPNVINYVVGILTVRNSVLPVIDIRKLFGMRLLVDELLKELIMMEKISKQWVDAFRQSISLGTGYKNEIDAEKTQLGKWTDNFRTASEGIGKAVQELRYANLKLYEVGKSISLKSKDCSIDDNVIAVDKSLIPVYKQLELKFEQMKDAVIAEISEDQRILVVEINGKTVGILVDRMQQVIRVLKSTLENPPFILSSEKSEALKSIVKIDEGKRIILLLNEKRVITNQRIQEIEGLKNRNEIKTDETIMSVEVSRDDEIQVVTFRLGKEEFGIGIEEVQEINRINKITSVPHTQSFIEGVMNLRGNVIPIIELKKRFGMPLKEYDDATRVIIITIMGKLTGLIVDSVSEVLRLSKDTIEAAPKIIKSKSETEYLKGVCKLDKANRMILLLAVDKILTFDEQNILSDCSLNGKPAIKEQIISASEKMPDTNNMTSENVN
jgi:purine-binding chemotaxis protein CheW